jgi:hypothetical protein
MQRHDFLRRLHHVTAARNYLEIGVRDGTSLALSRVPSIGIDPAFRITRPIRADVHLVRETSDAFFARRDPLGHLRSARNPLKNVRRGRPLFGRYLGRPTLDLAFIDGMHLFEYALRDFMNVEKYAGWASAIAFDDMLPRNADEAARDRHTGAWAGDVYKVIPVLHKYRPDLTVIQVDTKPTGTVVVLGADPTNTVLGEHYDEIAAEWVVNDPQDVPDWILDRRQAIRPKDLLAAPFWPRLVRARNLRLPRSRGYDALRAGVAALPPARPLASPAT